MAVEVFAIFLFCAAINFSTASNFSVSLYMGQTSHDGVVMLHANGLAGPACGVEFGKNEAVATCKHLGFIGGDPLCCKPYGKVAMQPHMRTTFSCKHGNESSLHHCKTQTFNHTHLHAQDWEWWEKDNTHTLPKDAFCRDNYAAVSCYPYHAPPSQMDLKLSLEGPSNSSGRLVLTYGGVKGGVCGEGWNQQAADRACKDLGFQHGTNVTHVRLQEQAVGPVWTANVNCEGATAFPRCTMDTIGTVTSCDHYAGVYCFHDQNHTKEGYPAYYVDWTEEGSAAKGGVVRVYLDGQWGTITSLKTSWTQATLDVICSSLGYARGKQLPSNDGLMTVSGPVWEVAMDCGGHEADLMHCKVQGGWTKADSQNHVHDLKVACFPAVELRHGVGHHDGVVYIKTSSYRPSPGAQMSPVKEQWQPVCFDNFDSNAARVVCRELGFNDGVSLCCGDSLGYLGNFQNELYIPMAKTNGSCTGWEHHLSNCTELLAVSAVAEDGSSMCKEQYAAVSCFAREKPKDYELSLRYNAVYYDYMVYNDYSDYNYDYDISKLENETWGALIVTYNGLSGYICPDGWSDTAADVACREMGYGHGQMYLHSSYYDSYYTNYLYWSSNFECTGNPNKITDCKHDGFGHVKECREKEAYAGVLCFNDQGVKYRLYNTDPHATWGRLEVLMPEKEEWSPLCNNPTYSWDVTEAKVVCRMFGYKTGQIWGVSQLPAPTGQMLERYDDCDGTEDHVDHCNHEGYLPAYSDACRNRSNEAGVYCTPYAPGEIPHKTTTSIAITTSPTTTPRPTTTTTRTSTTTATTTTKPTPTTTTTTTPKPTTTATTTTTTTTTTKLKPTTTSATTTEATSTATPDASSQQDWFVSSGGVVAGAVFGGLAVVVLAVGGVFLWRRRRLQGAQSSSAASSSAGATSKSPEEGVSTIRYDRFTETVQVQES